MYARAPTSEIGRPCRRLVRAAQWFPRLPPRARNGHRYRGLENGNRNSHSWFRPRWFGISLLLVWVAGTSVADTLPETGPCTCEMARVSGGWCPACKVGHLAGVQVRSRMLFEVLDAHGHEIQISALRCETCRKSAAEDGYCESCRIGFIGKKAFFTRLTYELAKGRPVQVTDPTCESCRKKDVRTWWCDRCQKGRIGNVTIRTQSGFDAAKVEFDRLLEAIDMLAKCESCAVAYFARSYCATCRKSYESPRSVEKPPP